MSIEAGAQAEHMTVWHLNGQTSRFFDVEFKESNEFIINFLYKAKSDGLPKAATLYKERVSMISVYTGEANDKG